MAYLIASDYNRLIQDTSLQQIISGNLSLKAIAESVAIAEIKSYLRQKYDVDLEFTDTTVYVPTSVSYKAGNRVYLDAPFYNPNSIYVLHQLVLKIGFIYRCTTAIPVAEEFNASKWEKLGAQYDIFYAPYPVPLFNLKDGLYEIDDIIFWKDKKYKALIASSGIDHDSAIQLNSINEIPYGNVFPDNLKNGSKYWLSLGTYSIAANKILDTVYFSPGDNRNQQLVNYVLDILIYNLYRRIPPSIVPEIRILAYQTALAWLKKVATGEDIVADISRLQPPQGGRIRFGSRVKLDNFY